MVGWGMRGAFVGAAMLALAQLTAGLGVSGAASVEECANPKRFFAVKADTGHLAELRWCTLPKSITEVGEVDGGDWRTAGLLFATGNGTVTVVYAVTADGRLEARRQDSPGAPLGTSVEVGVGIDWSRFDTVVVPRRGFLWAGNEDVRAFRHVDWATGGATLVEGPPVFTRRDEWPTTGDLLLTGFSSFGWAEARYAGTHWRVWRDGAGLPVAYPSGRTPYGMKGTEADPYTIRSGTIYRLVQPLYDKNSPVNYSNCLVNTKDWQIAAELPGGWAEVVVPQSTPLADGLPAAGEWPEVGPKPAAGSRFGGPCPPGVTPYEWQ
ncbi:MAG: hypothetical protein HOY78_18205 [Saccharothrix sp.]|nr:hypothetical protein [Saccharothrix sp.]